VLEARPPSVAPGEAAQPEGAAQPTPERHDALATEVARAVRELRTNAGLSERAAARLLGTSQTQLRRMEDPRYLPSLRSLARLAAAYEHRVSVSFEPKERPPQRPPARPRATPTRAKRATASRMRSPKARRRP
jgi:transcriptional regulator with XRE-family HTH domain